MKISFIGAGGVGCSTAFASGLKNLCNEIVLIDLYKDYSIGKAIDLQQAFILNEKDVKVIGSDDYNDIKGSDAIVITAGIATNGNADRESLLEKNKEIIGDIAKKLTQIIPNDDKQPLIIMVTNPLDVILNHFIKVGNFNKKKTIGSGNWLDTARFKYYLAQEFNVPESKINTFVVGQHGKKMVYLLSHTTIDGKPLFDCMKEKNISMDKMKEIQKRSLNGAETIIKLIVKGGTFYGPAISILALLDSYINDKKSNLIASVYCDGEYGINDFCIGCPIILGKNGVEKIQVFTDLTEEENKLLNESKDFINSLNS